MSGKEKTCGEFYKEAIQKYGMTESTYWAFAAGFVSGQAEKVFIGACRAAMFRPSVYKMEQLIEIVCEIANRYSLTARRLADEIWIWRTGDGAVEIDLERMIGMPSNNWLWHAIRADLCGISLRQFDPKFHERDGYGQDCDLVQKGNPESAP